MFIGEKRTAVVFLEGTTVGVGEDLVREARRLGITPIMVAKAPKFYPYSDQLHTVVCDTSDNVAVISQVRILKSQWNVIGIGTTSDFSVESAFAAAEEFDLPRPSIDALKICRSKVLVRDLTKEYGPKYKAFSNQSISSVDISEFQYPVIVKPGSLNGGVGVKLCTSETDAVSHANHILNAEQVGGLPNDKVAIVEEFVKGSEYSVECFDAKALGVTKVMLADPDFIEVGHIYPAPINETLYKNLLKLAEEVLVAVGLMWGPAHVQFRSDDRSVALIEINPRLGGGNVNRIVYHSTGVNLAAAYVRKICGLSLGETLKCTISDTYSAVYFALAPEEGTLFEIDQLAALQRDSVVEVGSRASPGQSWVKRGTNQDRIAYAITRSTDAEDAKRSAEHACGDFVLSWR